jgi:N-acyl homoserine lactone hydrolase
MRAARVVVFIGPPLVAMGAIYNSGKASRLGLAVWALFIVALLLADAFVVARCSWGLAAAALVLTIPLVLFLMTYLPSPLPRPAPVAGPLPRASPPEGMAAFQLPTGVNHRTASFGYRGGSFLDWRDFAMTGVLVEHPGGDLLIDTGLGREIDTQFRLMPFSLRAVTRYERYRSSADQLDAAGYDRKRLRGILLTHAHWDHVSGAQDLTGTPMLVTASERRYVDEGGFNTAIARSIRDARWEVYDFEGGPYLGFAKSHDFYGDGSIVAVPAPGHTPGSVIVFVTLPGDRRYALVGDLVWQREGITELEERPWVVRRDAEVDPAGVRENILRVSAVAQAFPSMTIVPAHDFRFVDLPKLEPRRAN